MEFVLIVLFAVLVIGSIACAFILRRVVKPNEVHIVQSSSGRKTYGMVETNNADHEDGDVKKATSNAYYSFPSSWPKLGVQVSVLPTQVFDQDLKNYEAYDKDRVPFVLDVKAFFRIFNPQLAAERINTMVELKQQLEATLQGAVRTILASSSIEEIMQGRSEFGSKFTSEVDTQLREWGVKTVKSIELMDIRDAANSKVIANIMAKRKSFIEMQSRVEVAANNQKAEIAEIEAKRETDLQRQQAEQVVGIRTAEVAREVGIAQEKTHQAVQDQAKVTAAAEAEVRRVQEVKQAEIRRDVEVVTAEQKKRTEVISAEAAKQRAELIAQGQLSATKNEAEGVAALGTAKADAERAMLMAPVQAQVELAREIGSNEGYQTYLVRVKEVDANKEVGIAQAGALSKADVKVIANTGNAVDGISSVGKMFSPAGGTQLAGMLEAFVQSDEGAKLIEKFLSK